MNNIDENRRIGRRIYQTTCHCITYDENKKRVEFDCIIDGTCSTIDRAASRVKKELGIQNVLVTGYDTESHYYSMSASDFIKHATRVTD